MLFRSVGGFDLVVEAAGDAQIMLDVLGLLRRNGVGCLLGLDARPRTVAIDGPVIGIDAVLENRVLLGSVNAHPDDWRAAVTALEEIRRRHPDALEAMVGLRVAPDRFANAGWAATAANDHAVASADAALAALAGRCRTLAEALRAAALAYERSDEAAAERFPASGRAV